MISRADFKHLLFLDIETVPCTEQYAEMDGRLQHLWDRKAHRIRERERIWEEHTCEDIFQEQAGIFAEFGKIVAIGVGCLRERQGYTTFTTKSYASRDEMSLLIEFNKVLEKYPPERLILCAHNGKEFDFPYLARRMLINGIKLPYALVLHGKKPWEVPHLDTLELWKFGDKKSYTSLDLLAAIFDIPSSKAEIDGSQVRRVFYEEGDPEKVARYCALDVINVAQVLLRMSGMPIVEAEYLEPVKIEIV